MKAAQTFFAILIGLLLTPSIFAQSESEGIAPLFEVHPCDAGYQWSLKIDMNRDGQLDRELHRACNGTLSQAADSLTVWEQITNDLVLIDVQTASPMMREERTDSGTVWYIDEFDMESGKRICSSALRIDAYGGTYIETDCKHRLIGTPCVLDFGTTANDASESTIEEQEKEQGTK